MFALVRHRKTHVTCGVLAATVAVALLLHPTQSPAAGLLVSDGGFGGVLEIKEQDVRVTINNSIVHHQ